MICNKLTQPDRLTPAATIIRLFYFHQDPVPLLQ